MARCRFHPIRHPSGFAAPARTDFPADSLSTSSAWSYPDRTPTSRRTCRHDNRGETSENADAIRPAPASIAAPSSWPLLPTPNQSRPERHTPAAQALSRPAYGTDSPQVMGYAAEHDMRHGVNLRFHRRIQLRVVITMNGRPPRRTSPQSGVRPRREPARSFGPLNGIYRQRRGHGSVRMPNMAFIEGQIVRCHNRLVNQIKKI
ncbi:Uncharacterised protein [Salmonella enterica subsp. enterica serovar Derby]|nr:Uncharacterised protein [Salmonella enterica subsp. enterica serovar Derby]